MVNKAGQISSKLSKNSNIIDLVYQRHIEEGTFIEGCVSRKKHVVPAIMEILES